MNLSGRKPEAKQLRTSHQPEVLSHEAKNGCVGVDHGSGFYFDGVTKIPDGGG